MTRDWTYGNDFFRNGVKVSDSARRYYWELGPNVSHLGDPFGWLDDAPAASLKSVRRLQADVRRSGVNLMGSFQAETAAGEEARSNLRIMRTTGLPCVVNNYVAGHSDNIAQLPDQVTEANPFLINLLTINPKWFVTFAKEHAAYLAGHYNVGYWGLNLPEFPKEWETAFGFVDEIWTPSSFTYESIVSHSPLPVKIVPNALDMEVQPRKTERAKSFGIEPGLFVFLSIFDFHSCLDRKNPVGLIRAFKNAFGGRPDVQLLLQAVHADIHSREYTFLQEAATGANVRFVETVLTRDATRDLMMAADCYVSLHRAEAFGVPMAEAMLLAKPVIATAYSGNIDFMTAGNSFLVPYRMVPIEASHGSYKAGCRWAEPDLDYACDLMRYIEHNREAAAEVGQRAAAHVRRVLHPEVIGASVVARLKELDLIGESTGAQPPTIVQG